ncbi:MAG: rod shape-determining protein MreD [Chloroflexota bacterium]|nr:rod shape-determining protein MreD [Chloroflexota bacterium]
MIAARFPRPRRRWQLRTGAVGAALLLLMLGLLQTSVFPSFAIAGIRPALVLMAAVTLATVSDDSRALYWGFLGGLVVDLLSATPTGVNALLFTLLVYIVGGQGRRFDRANLVFPVLAGAAATVLYYPAVVLTLQVQGFDIDWGQQVWDRLPRAVAVNAGATTLLYPVVRLADRWTRPENTARYVGHTRGGRFD